MADTRLLDSTLGLSEVTAPTGTEVVRVITDPAGTPASAQMTLDTLAGFILAFALLASEGISGLVAISEEDYGELSSPDADTLYFIPEGEE